MASKHVLKFSSINEFFGDNKIIKRGENALESNHVKAMQFDASLMSIRGEIFASMKDKTYKSEIILNESGNIVEAKCNCPRGIKCHHIATLALFGHYNISITDKECSWNMPKTKSEEVKTAEEMYPAKPYCAIDRQLEQEEVQNLTEKLSKFGNTVGFTWLLQKESQEKQVGFTFPNIEDILSSNEMFASTDKGRYLKEKCAVDDDKIKEIARITTGQVKSEEWFLVRKFRITASNFGTIISCCKRNRFPESLFKSLLGSYNLDGVKSIQWGKTHEKNGLDYLKKNFDLAIQPTGIWLTNSGLLGASPDGLVGEDAIVEVKCPYTYRNDKLSEKLKNNNKYIVYYNDNGDIVLNKAHNYYHQIQGNLHILKRTTCHLCIWTLQEVVVIQINIDPSWAENLVLLEDFYIKHYLPQLSN